MKKANIDNKKVISHIYNCYLPCFNNMLEYFKNQLFC